MRQSITPQNTHAINKWPVRLSPLFCFDVLVHHPGHFLMDQPVFHPVLINGSGKPLYSVSLYDQIGDLSGRLPVDVLRKYRYNSLG